MRFVFLIGLLIAICACPVVSFAQSIDIGEPAERSFTPRMQKGKQSNLLRPRDGFSLEIVESGLGNIASITLKQDGTIFVADAETGRIWQLLDRNKDGRVDIKRALPHRFDRPTGLAVTGELLYIADRAAVWVIQENQPPKKLAGLMNADSTGAFHPLTISSDNKTLFLGLTKKDGTSHILSVDQNTGQAEEIKVLYPSEQLRSIVSLRNNTIWSLMTQSLGLSFSVLTKIDDSHRLVGLALPQDKKGWTQAYSQHAIVSIHSADGFVVLALPATLGAIETKGDILLSGFSSSSGRSAWGRPGALLFDSYGLLVADAYNGDLYRLRPVNLPTAQSEPRMLFKTTTDTITTSDKDALPSNVLSTITGSQIDRVSGIDSATTIDIGSTIIRDYKPLEIDKASETQNQDQTPPN